MRRTFVFLVLAVAVGFCASGGGAESAAWIWSDGHGVARVFRNVFTNATDASLSVDVTGDTHYVLKFDGKVVGRGPDLSVPEDWLYRTYVIPASAGEHVLEAVVYHGGPKPYSQTSCRAGFLLKGHGAFDEVLTTGKGAWRAADVVNVDYGGETGGAFGAGLPNIVRGSSPEAVSPPDAAFGPVTTVRAGMAGHSPYHHVPPPWRISPTQLPPPVSRRFAAPSDVLPLFVPAHSRRVVDIPLGGYFCAFPLLETKGGKGAKVRLAWSESADKLARNSFFEDTFLPEGGYGKFTTSLFRCGTICRLSVETGDEPLSVESFVFDETHYPVDGGGRFACDDPSLDGVFRICRRGLEMCAHGGGVYDCPFYERNVYFADTRVQFLAQNALSSDGRLQRRVLELFSRSRAPDGIMPMNFPCDGPQSPSATFTLVYPIELDDYLMWHGDVPWVSSQMPGLAATMEGLARFENADALLENLPGWCFVDWADWAPNGAHIGAGPEAGSLSCIENLFYVLALDAASRVASSVGRADLAAVYSARRAKTAAAVVRFWDDGKGAFSDDPGHCRFSEHAQALALLADVPDDPVRRARCAAFLADAPDLTRVSVYFSHYLFDAYARIGRADLIEKRLSLWREYVARGYATPLEMPEPSRSDCHGWGAHPLYHFAASFAGVRPDAPGFARVRIAPQFGSLARIDCRVPHLKGFVGVSLRRDGNRVAGTVSLPEGVAGVFVWNGERREFSGRLALP